MRASRTSFGALCLVLVYGATTTLSQASGGTSAPCTNTSFAQPAGSPISVGDLPQSVAVGDFNVDGKADLATANLDSGNVTILLGDGTGGFTQPIGSPVAAENGPGSVGVGDFNGDGKPDLAVSNVYSDNVTILLSDGTGGFTQPTGSPVAAGDGPTPLVVNDFNGDSKVDLAVVNQNSNRVTILLGDGTGAFTQPAGSPFYTVGDGPFGIAAGDFNGDAKPDLVVTHIFTENLTILLNDGTGGFADPGPFSYFAEGPTSVTTGDFNNDGKLDMAVTSVGAFTKTVSILLGDGNASFTQSAVPIAGTPWSVAASDFNRDGNPDLAVVNVNPNHMGILLGDGTGAFTQPTGSPFFVAGEFPASLAVSDFNGDGMPDVATANQYSDDVTILINTCDAQELCTDTSFTQPAGSPIATGYARFPAVGDFNRDFKLDLAVATLDSVTILLGDGTGSFPVGSGVAIGNQPYSVGVGDFNSDAKPDIVTANPDSNNVTILLGDGAGGFAQSAVSPVAAGDGPYCVAVGDLNGDGRSDLVTANHLSNDVTVLLSHPFDGFIQADGSPNAVNDAPIFLAIAKFNADDSPDLAVVGLNSNDVTILLGYDYPSFHFVQHPGSPVAVGEGPFWAAVGDFNSDGKSDLATANVGSQNVTILLNDGTGAFVQSVDSPVFVGDVPSSVAAADFNGDGKLDLATTHLTVGTVTILSGDGMGGFTQPPGSPIGVGAEPESMAVGDFNDDGKPDLVTTNMASTDMTILLNTCEGGQTAVCDAGGPYAAVSDGMVTEIQLQNSSSDPDGDSLSFVWSSDCAGAEFLPSATDAEPVLRIMTSGICQLQCGVSLTASDGAGSESSCGSSVTVTVACDDENPCTEDACIEGAGCVYTPITCNDGVACTSDSCDEETGACVNLPIDSACNDYNACTDDSCDPVGGCVYSNNTAPCDDYNDCTSGDVCQSGVCVSETVLRPAPKTKGHYKKMCQRNELTEEQAACVGATAPWTFGEVDTVAEVCDEIDGHDSDLPSHDSDERHCTKDETELLVLALNLCTGRLCSRQEIDPIDHGDYFGRTVQHALRIADAVFAFDRSKDTCHDAKQLIKDINTGKSIRTDSLRLQKVGNAGVLLSWSPPYVGDDQVTIRYELWRSPRGADAFAMIHAGTSTSYVDSTDGDFDYDVLAEIQEEGH